VSTGLATRVHASDRCRIPGRGGFSQESKIGGADAVGALDGFCPVSDNPAAGAWTPPCGLPVIACIDSGPKVPAFRASRPALAPPKRELWRERRRAHRGGGASGPAGRLETVQKVLTDRASGQASGQAR
jgi:hypothetical protein